MLESEARSYHEPRTCTFYGTANSNKVILEMMGFHTCRELLLSMPIHLCVML
nr:dihydroxy-acid dehydratase [Bartonella quintana]